MSSRHPDQPKPIDGCSLHPAGLGNQLARYRQLGHHADTVERLLGQVRVRFSDDVPTGLLGLTLDIERRCCPFVTATRSADGRELTLTVENIDQDPRLDSLFAALTRP
jgi:hypothetical protein